MEIQLVIERLSKNKLAKADDQRKEIASAADKRASSPGVVGKATKLIGPVERMDEFKQIRQFYTFTVTLEKTGYRSEAAALKAIENGRKFVEKCAEGLGWTVKGEVQELKAVEVTVGSRTKLDLPPLDEEVKNLYFSGILERDAHMRLIYKSIETYVLTEGEERNHTLLFGDPASAKSSVLTGFKSWLDGLDGYDRILQVNATTLTKAGLEKILLEKAQDQMLPDVLWINELEKAESSDFLCLLSVMDGMGKIQRLNSRIGKQEGKCNILVFADCNDGLKVKSWNNGALWSRFPQRLPCVRPSRDVMTKILFDMVEQRELKGYPADKKWVKIAIDYAFDAAKNNDPRFVKSLLSAGDDLVNGNYFRDIEFIENAYRVAEEAKTKP